MKGYAMKEDTVIKLKRQEEKKGFDILTDILRRGAKKSFES
jgi:hypothetical protein